MNIGARISLKGVFNLQVVDKDGNVKREMEFENIITNAGFDRWRSGLIFGNLYSGQYGSAGAIRIGTGTTAPTPNDVNLQSTSATAAFSGSSFTNSGSPDYITTQTAGGTFAIGTLNGNYSEIGIGWTNFNQSGTWLGLFSRALIKDGNGNPTTITVLSDEQLNVSYSIKSRVSMTDATQVITVNGVETTLTIRPHNIDYVTDTSMTSGYYDPNRYRSNCLPVYSSLFPPLNQNSVFVTNSAMTTTIGQLTGTTSSQPSTQTLLESGPTATGYYYKVRYFWPTGNGNMTINTFVTQLAHQFQIGISPAFTKTSLQTMTIDVTYYLDRE